MTEVRVSPDGKRYLAMAQGQRVPRPFAYRWLVPRVIGERDTWWVWSSALSVVSLCLLAVAYTHTWYAIAVPLALSGLTLNLKLPVLVDAPAMGLALGAACCAQRGWYPLAAALVLVAGACKETSPVFAALYAWNPVLLVGLAAPAIRHLWKPGEDVLTGPAHDALEHPLLASREAHAGQWLNPLLWLLPWGPLLIGASRPTWQVAATLLVAYGQCLIATDSIRLYVWAWPVLLDRTFHVLPEKWWLLVVILAFANPFKGSGI